MVRTYAAVMAVGLFAASGAIAQCPSDGVAVQTVDANQPHPPTFTRSDEVYMAYDRARHVTVALNKDPTTGLFEEWTYVAGAWNNTTSGFAVQIAGIVFDTTRSRLVAVGKHAVGDTFSSTWVREASGWVRNAVTFPTAIPDTGNVVYDPGRDRYDVLVSVPQGANYIMAVAEIDPVTWSWTVGPAYAGTMLLNSETMAFDPIGGNVQFWGYDTDDRERVVTYQAPGTWTDLALSNPLSIGARNYSTGVWVDAWQCMVISTGVNSVNRYTLSSQNSFARLFLDGAAPYEARKTWPFARYPDAGTQQPTRVHVGMAYDSDRNVLVVFGGEYYYIASQNPMVGEILAHANTYEFALPPSTPINVQPTGYTGCVGDTHDLAFVPQFGTPQGIQWFFRAPGSRSFQPIPGATTLSYPGRPWQASDNGTYVARVTTPREDITCNARTRSWTALVDVSVSAPLSFVGQAQWPSDACPGGAVMVTAPSVVGPNPTIALQKLGADSTWSDVSFATPEEPFFFLSNLSQADSGLYRVNARNSCNSIVTAQHRIQVGVTMDGPLTVLGDVQPCGSIQLRPLNGSVHATGAVSYQWFLDGVALRETARVSGTHTSLLTISSLDPSDAGVYELRATEGACQSTASLFRDLTLPEPATATYVARNLPGSLPPARQLHAMAFDEARGEVVLFGGVGRDAFNQSIVLGDTWTYDGAAWTARTPAHSPGLVSNAAMVYDRARAKVILFGGNHALCPSCAAPPKAEIWEWDGSDWSQRSATGPADDRAANPAMAYDPVAACVVVYTGSNPVTSQYQGQTWIYDPVGNAWNNVALTGPGTANGTPSMYFDSFRQRRVMYAFGPVTGPLDAAVPAFWEWNGTQWIAALADLSGSWQGNQQPFPYCTAASSTWAYNPAFREGESGLMTVIPPGGGGFWNGTYTYAGSVGGATRLTTNNGFGRSGSAQVWDSSRRCMVVFGGQDTFPGSPTMGRPTNSSFERHYAGRPRILDQPRSEPSFPGDPVQLRCVSVGSDPLVFQWTVGGIPLINSSDVSGANSSTLTIARPVAHPGSYACVVSNACGSVTSVSVQMSFCAADLDDGSGAGTPDGAVTIDDLLFFLGAYEAGALAADLDSDGDPGAGTPDGAVTIDDLLFFLARFEGGC